MTFAHLFVGPEPLPIKGGDTRILANGLPITKDYRIVSEGNYIRMMRCVEKLGVVIDETQELD